MGDLGVGKREIDEVSYDLWKYAELAEKSFDTQQLLGVFKEPEFATSMLPNSSIEISKSIDASQDFLEVAEYCFKRLGDFHDFYWSPEHPRRLIIPFKINNRIVGWTGRCIDELEKNRYIGRAPKNYIYNTDESFSEKRKYIIVVDGCLDAKNISGVATMGASINDDQIQWLNRQNKEIILLPDNDRNGQKSCQIAVDNGWAVSFPRLNTGMGNFWAPDIKDATQACSEYGRLYTLMSIINSRVYENDIALKMKFLI